MGAFKYLTLMRKTSASVQRAPNQTLADSRAETRVRLAERDVSYSTALLERISSPQQRKFGQCRLIPRVHHLQLNEPGDERTNHLETAQIVRPLDNT